MRHEDDPEFEKFLNMLRRPKKYIMVNNIGRAEYVRLMLGRLSGHLKARDEELSSLYLLHKKVNIANRRFLLSRSGLFKLQFVVGVEC